MDNSEAIQDLKKEREIAIATPVDYYQRVTGRSLDLLPESLRGGYARWWLFGMQAGSFLQSVIEGDLYMTAANADATNAGRLFNIVSWFWNNADSASIRANASAWGEAGGYFGLLKERIEP